MLGEVFGRMEQAKEHVERASAMVTAALTELGRADVLLKHTMQGNADQSVVAMADRARQQLTGARQGTAETTKKIDETLARWRGTGSLGNS
jgi:CHASE3 domain sensor protein